jgi:hypothetical protein
MKGGRGSVTLWGGLKMLSDESHVCVCVRALFLCAHVDTYMYACTCVCLCVCVCVCVREREREREYVYPETQTQIVAEASTPPQDSLSLSLSLTHSISHASARAHTHTLCSFEISAGLRVKKLWSVPFFSFFSRCFLRTFFFWIVAGVAAVIFFLS